VITDKLKKGIKKIRSHGLLFSCRYYFRRWIKITFFYYIKEPVIPDIPAHLKIMPDNFQFSVFDLEDVIAISKMEERKDYAPEMYVIDSFNAGDTCLGIKKDGEIAAFAWLSINECRDTCYQAKMKDYEAYLYDIYVIKSFRRRNLATILRYETYDILKRLGRTTCYSISECSNTPSFQFKKKMGGEALFLGLCIAICKKHHIRCVLKKYQ
jgi:ribosomal protein S18 acetylase RimI-like enzyme